MSLSSISKQCNIHMQNYLLCGTNNAILLQAENTSDNSETYEGMRFRHGRSYIMSYPESVPTDGLCYGVHRWFFIKALPWHVQILWCYRLFNHASLSSTTMKSSSWAFTLERTSAALCHCVTVSLWCASQGPVHPSACCKIRIGFTFPFQSLLILPNLFPRGHSAEEKWSVIGLISFSWALFLHPFYQWSLIRQMSCQICHIAALWSTVPAVFLIFISLMFYHSTRSNNEDLHSSNL